MRNGLCRTGFAASCRGRIRTARSSEWYGFCAMVGIERRAVPARVVAGGTNIRATMAFEGAAPLHAARTSQRNVATTLNTHSELVKASLPRLLRGGTPARTQSA